MAIYRLNLRAGTGVKPTSPLKGGKSAAKYDYNMREGHYKPKEGEVSDLLYTSNKNFEKMGYDPRKFWLMSEDKTVVGNRHTSFKEFKLTLPSELSLEQNIALVEKFAEETFGDKYLYTLAIHAPDFENNQEKKDKGEKQIHCHIQFAMGELTPEDYKNKTPMKEILAPHGFTRKKIDGVLTKVEYGHTKKNQYMNSTKERINERTGKKEPTFLQVSRQKWENILNAGLEKYNKEEQDKNPNFEPIEPVSCKTLKQQREEALANGDFAKAEMLNREPINKDFRLYKQDKNTLSVADKVKLQQHDINLKTKQDKVSKYRNKILSSDPEQLIKSMLDSYPAKYSKAKKKPNEEQTQASVLNVLTNGDYFRIRNGLKKKKKKEKDIAIATLEFLKNKHIDTPKFTKKMSEFNSNYDKKINKEVSKLELEENTLNTILDRIIQSKKEKSEVIEPIKSVVVEDVNDPAKDSADVPDTFVNNYWKDMVEEAYQLFENYFENEDYPPTTREDVNECADDYEVKVNQALKEKYYAKGQPYEDFFTKGKDSTGKSTKIDIIFQIVCTAKEYSVDIQLGKIEKMATEYSK